MKITTARESRENLEKQYIEAENRLVKGGLSDEELKRATEALEQIRSELGELPDDEE